MTRAADFYLQNLGPLMRAFLLVTRYAQNRQQVTPASLRVRQRTYGRLKAGERGLLLEATMPRLISEPDLEHRPFPLLSTVLGLLAAMNVTSAAAMLLSM